MDLISIIVPVYNAKKYLKVCINSLMNQTYKCIEIILVDDGSLDGSGLLLDEYVKRDYRIKVIHQANQGSVLARKKGVEMISENSVYFVFCDADDVLPEDAIEVLYHTIRKDDSDICVGNSLKLLNKIKIQSKYIPSIFNTDYSVYSHQEFIENLYCSWFGISNVPVGLWAKMYKTKIFRNIYLNCPNVVNFFGEDLIQTIRMFPMAKKIAFTNKIVYYYRVGGGTSKYQPQMMNDWISLYNYKDKFAKKYYMSQDIHYLMDIELCNMTFTYFNMLMSYRGISEIELKEEIIKICSKSEVKKAASNEKIIFSRFDKAFLIRECLVDEIYNYIKQSYNKQSFKRLIKKIILYFN